MPQSHPDVRILHLTPAAFHALADGDAATAATVIPVPVTPYLLGPECGQVWRRRAAQCDADPRAASWVTGLVWAGSLNKAVGAAGFHGPPDSSGVVEIGYGIDPDHRGNGYARTALEDLLSRAIRDPRVTRVRVSIAPDNLASRSLATAFGFRQVGERIDAEDGLELVYERPAYWPEVRCTIRRPEPKKLAALSR
ncbi:GNAT family N-acetyltransferase [Actinoplanes couchii]|uniref:GNAT family N-acetyltransferase n=1 Tax=Actinoplanes couchii TaxID=403638 RepID=UPI0019458B47|nr:GNAT family N-acetyltransferase [Actinoplanes couchii]MDR6317735.1 RimJ/RimL family protein N-acetyltransferase [Actinoplanes couchii]